MNNTRNNPVWELMERATHQGIRISVNDKGDLQLSCAKDKRIEPEFLEELKSNKQSLIDFFKGDEKEPEQLKDLASLGEPAIMRNGLAYYSIGPAQEFWVDEGEDLEFKRKQHGVFNFGITGEFSLTAFQKAVGFVMERHESLRSTFHHMDERYYMRVEHPGDERYAVRFYDLREEKNDDRLQELLGYYEDFDLANGPLLFVNLCRTDDDAYAVSFKLHHVIFDGWAVDVLFRDVFTAYTAFSNGHEPDLPALKFQYRHYLHYLARSAVQFRERDKQYWFRSFRSLPQPVLLPGFNRNAKEGVEFDMKDGYYCSLARMMQLSRKYNTSLFVIIQTLFKRYLQSLTNENDFTICTQVFGRDLLEGSEHQIGLYAKMNVVRTVLEKEGSFSDAVGRVKQSNEALQAYRSYSLLDAFQSLMPGSKKGLKNFSPFMLEFMDGSGYMLSPEKHAGSTARAAFDIQPLVTPEEKTHALNTDMKIFFKTSGDELFIKIIWDCGLYSGEVIDRFILDFMKLGESAEIF